MTDKITQNFGFRASIPTILRYAGVTGTVAAIIAVVIGFYVSTTNEEFRSGDFPGELSEKVIGIVNGYHRKETEGGVLKYAVEASVAKTFDDNHQELDDVILKLYKDGDQSSFDEISSERAIYVPKGTTRDYQIFFAGNVVINTASDLEVKTDQMNYKSLEGIAAAEEFVTFKRHNISGSSFGALVDVDKQTIELQKDVSIIASKSTEAGAVDLDVKLATIRSGYALIEGIQEVIRLRNGVAIALTPEPGGGLKQPTDITALTASVFLTNQEVRKIEMDGDVVVVQSPTSSNPQRLKASARHSVALIDGDLRTLRLIDSVSIETAKVNAAPVFISSDSGKYDKTRDTFELNDRVEIRANKGTAAMHARAAKAVYEQTADEITLSGGSEVERDNGTIRAESIFAELTPSNSLKFANAVNDAHLVQKSASRRTEVFSESMQAWFSNDQITKANVRGKSSVNVSPTEKGSYSRFKLAAPKGLNLDFDGGGFLTSLDTIGRTTLHLDAGSDGKSQSDKTLTADQVKTSFRPRSNELAKAHAIGNAELVVLPKSSAAGKFRSYVRAPRFDCDFFEGNNARVCTSTKRSFLERKALDGKRPLQRLQTDKMSSYFDRQTRNVSMYEAIGKSKFSEGEKHGIADRISYKLPAEKIELRGGNPTVWDSKARAKAPNIDWYIKKDESVLAGGVSTTYFNKRKTGDTAPFSGDKAPVFLTSDSAKFDHAGMTAVYTGNARAWQDKSYVRGDQIYINERSGQFFAEGRVQSMVFDGKKADGNGNEPVFVTSHSMLYLRDKRQVHYEKNVDIRQGSGRIIGNVADVFLDEKNNVVETLVTGGVSAIQPGRKATGEYLRHNTTAESIELRGNPATFFDREAGSSSGKVINVDLKNKKTVNSGRSTKTGTGRTRSVYKVKQGRIN